MITDYESFLRVAEDGHIWWLKRDAIRLGAGFLPVRDDHQNLNTELRAPNNRALVNERTLIGAFGSDRLSIERPMMLERDSFRYVEAGEFLTWLSQYIAQTQVKIAFPNELVREVRMAKAKAAVSSESDTSQEFESLTQALDGWFDKNLNDLPEAIRQRVERDYLPLPWNGLSADQRCSAALQWDFQHDPATEQERKYWWDFFTRLDELEQQIAEWESAETPTARDLALKESRLKELRKERDRMDLQKRQARGDFFPERERLDADTGTTIPTDKGGRPKTPLTEAIESAFLYFRNKGDVAILERGNIKSFLKSMKGLLIGSRSLADKEFWNVKAYIEERINKINIPRAGEYTVVTIERHEGRKIIPGKRYRENAVSKVLTELRRKYPLTS